MIVGSQIIKLDSVGSTNNYAAKLMEGSKVQEGTAILASFQENGRGQRGANWQSKAGDNLLGSIILYPNFLFASQQFYLSQAVSLAIHQLLRDIGISAEIKWPNDLLVRGKKIAGILIENSLRGQLIESSIVGIGLNVNQINFDLAASSIKLEMGKDYSPEGLAVELFAKLDQYYALLRSGNKTELSEAYHQNLYGVNQQCDLKIKGERKICKVHHVSPEGSLFLDCNGEVFGPFTLKEVEWNQL